MKTLRPLNLPLSSISAKRTAINWLEMLTKDSVRPLKFFDKQEAKDWLKTNPQQNVRIERGLFRFDYAWLILSDDGTSYVGKDGYFHQCIPKANAFYKERISFGDNSDPSTKLVVKTYYWDRDSAISSVPHDSKILRADTIYTPSGSLIFARTFCNLGDLPPNPTPEQIDEYSALLSNYESY
jgi:hypothetical protein